MITWDSCPTLTLLRSFWCLSEASSSNWIWICTCVRAIVCPATVTLTVVVTAEVLVFDSFFFSFSFSIFLFNTVELSLGRSVILSRKAKVAFCQKIETT